MIRINNVRFSIDEEINEGTLAAKLKIPPEAITELKLEKKSIDARKREDIHLVCSFLLEISDERLLTGLKNAVKIEEKAVYSFPSGSTKKRPIVVGFGPGGMFAALALAENGCRPIVIERGYAVDKRKKAVETFWDGGAFSPISNVQFGEGGAGTFSDGKLTTGINDPRCRYIIDTFIKYGANPEIGYSAKPHIGTDVLCEVVKNIRKRIIECGGEIHFETRLCDIEFSKSKAAGVTVECGGERCGIEAEDIILAIGHSARDTFKMLRDKQLLMEKKPFSVGVRIEHRAEKINFARYGTAHKRLPPADYKLSVHLLDGRGVYTFCMCPGGYVVASASEEGQVVTNGMSFFDRSGENSNSALLVSVLPEDLGEDIFDGIRLQEEIEKRAFELGGKNYYAPCQLLGDFLEGHSSEKLGSVLPTYRPGIRLGSIRELFPEYVTEALSTAIPLLDRRLKGFADREAVLTAPETRSSSPIRILRNPETKSAVGFSGLYPCGEGAGYAGGIMSAAADGLKCAEAVILRSRLT